MWFAQANGIRALSLNRRTFMCGYCVLKSSALRARTRASSNRHRFHFIDLKIRFGFTIEFMFDRFVDCCRQILQALSIVRARDTHISSIVSIDIIVVLSRLHTLVVLPVLPAEPLDSTCRMCCLQRVYAKWKMRRSANQSVRQFSPNDIPSEDSLYSANITGIQLFEKIRSALLQKNMAICVLKIVFFNMHRDFQVNRGSAWTVYCVCARAH